MPTVNINAIVLFLEESDENRTVTLEDAEKHFNVKLTDEQRKEIERQLQQNEENARREEDVAMEEADRIEEDYAGNE